MWPIWAASESILSPRRAAEVGVHGLHLAPDLVQRRRDDVLDRALDLVVDPHARHSINLGLLGQRHA
jgi:hypothetical protein